MSFYPVVSSHACRDDQPLHVCDDLEIIDEQHNADADRDSLSHHIKDNTPQLTQHSAAEYEDEQKEAVSPHTGQSPLAHLPHASHLSTAFPFHSPFHAHKHNKSSSSICSLPASPHDVSNEHKQGGSGAAASRRVSRSADPATLFLLHRIMKGDVFTLYTPSHSADSTGEFDATPVFLFYDAHGRLGSLYWTTQRRHGARHHTIHEDDDDSSRPASSALAASHFIRNLSASHCLPIHTLHFVGHGKPPILSSALSSSPLSSACFLTLHSPTHLLYLSHSEASVVRQWVACLRDIFVQNGHDVREADGGEALSDEEAAHKGRGGGVGGKMSAGLVSLFAEPTDGSDDDSGNDSGDSGGGGASSKGGPHSLVERDSGKRASLSLSDKSADCELLDKRALRKQQKKEMAMCQCVIC